MSLEATHPSASLSAPRRGALISPPAHEPRSAVETALLAALAASVAAVVMLVLSGERSLVGWLVSEQGPLERTAATLWFVLALALLRWGGGLNRCSLGLVAICLLFGARELDLHRLIADTSMLKTHFYRDGGLGWAQKALGGTLALAVLATLAWASWINGAEFLRRRLWLRAWGRIVLAAIGVLVLSKVMDRAPAVLEDEWGVAVSWTAHHLITLHEEWLEALVPGALLAALLLRARRRTPRAPAPGL